VYTLMLVQFLTVVDFIPQIIESGSTI